MREAESIIKVINSQLKDLYGVDIVTGLPIFRVVWSDDEYEHRHGTFDDCIPGTQIFLRTVTETRYLPKYQQWIKARHILERLVLVPEANRKDLPAVKVSYEPLMIFSKDEEHLDPDNYIPPSLIKCKFVVDTVLAAQAYATMMITGNIPKDRPSLAKYADPLDGKGTEEQIEMHNKKIDGIVNELYGDETGLMGTTLSRNQGGGSTIIVPHSIKINRE